MHKSDCVVDEILGEVITVFRSCWWFNPMIVIHELGIELISFSVKETIETIEASLQRPLVVRTSGRRVDHRAQVPLT